jgi:DNA-binding response OmpR family regulator
MKKNRILVIDDDATATRMVRMALERTGRFEVGELNDPSLAVNTARVFQPDLILLDVCMPDVEGSEVAGRINNDPVLADTPIIFLTCIVTPSEAGKTGSVVIGRHEYIAKPARPEKLIACIDANLERAHRPSAHAEYVTRS